MEFGAPCLPPKNELPLLPIQQEAPRNQQLNSLLSLEISTLEQLNQDGGRVRDSPVIAGPSSEGSEVRGVMAPMEGRISGPPDSYAFFAVLGARPRTRGD